MGKCISLRRLKIHELNTTLRKLKKKEQPWTRKIEVLSELEGRAAKQLTKHIAQLLLAYLVITSLRTDTLISISFQGVTASIPAGYFLASTSFLYLMTSLAINHFSAVLGARTAAGAKLISSGFSADIFLSIHGKNDNALGIPIFNSNFFKETLKTSAFLSFGLLLGLLSAAVPFFAFGVFLTLEQLQMITFASLNWAEFIAVAAGCGLTIFSFLNIALFHIPLPIKKNSYAIRWGFLINLTVDEHPKIKRWLDS